MKRNGIISFWKFLYAVMVVLFHGRILTNGNDFVLVYGGYIGVEFFFVVSGVFLASSIIKTWDKDNNNLGKDTLKFIWKKFSTFFPYILVAYVLIFGLYVVLYNFPIHRLASSIWELFLLQETGLTFLPVNVPIWYLSSMLICMFFIYPLMRKFKMNYVYFIAPVLVLLCLGIMNHTVEGLSHLETWIGFTYHHNFRAMAELNLGIIIYFISEKIKQINFTKFGKLCLTLIEFGCLLLPFFVTTFIKNSYRYDYIILLIISIGICIAVCNITLEKDILDKKTVYYFERLSLPLYIIHLFPLKVLYKLDYLYDLQISYATSVSILLGSALILAMILLKVIEGLRKKNFYLYKLKRLFIEE